MVEGDDIIDYEKENKELKQQLEVTEQMRQEVIDEGLRCEQQHIKNQNNIAISELEKLSHWILVRFMFTEEGLIIIKHIEQRINELRGDRR